MTLGQLEVNFRRFYAEARNKAGEPYSKSTLGFRHSLERYLNRPPFNQGLNLSSDPRFKRSNEMLNAQIVHLKRQGKENVKHKPAIEQGWRSGESTHLPLIWPGFESWRRHHVWVEFVVGSLPCSERFFSGYFGFPLSLKTNTFKFQFDLERTDTFQRVLMSSLVIRG